MFFLQISHFMLVGGYLSVFLRLFIFLLKLLFLENFTPHPARDERSEFARNSLFGIYCYTQHVELAGNVCETIFLFAYNYLNIYK